MRRILLIFSVLLFLSNALFAQTRTISGVVTGDKGETLPGVSIQVKGGTKGTTTDIDGKYSLVVTNLQTVVLTVKYIGYAYQEKAIPANERNADFKLVPTANNLNEVVVVGYGEQKKIHLTGAVSSINTKAIQDIPSTNLSEALKGQLPNVGVAGGDARPGNAGVITIRNPKFGNVTSASTAPLYIIDDAFRTPADFNLLDQSEVESISILKDAAAAIYGVQGANGVIVVRTKRGKAGAPKVEYAGSYGLGFATQLPKMMSATQQATMVNDALQTQYGYTINGATGINSNGGAKIGSYFTDDEMAYFANPANNTDWLREAWQTSAVQRHAVSVSGGTDKATFFANSSYTTQNTNFNTGASTNKWTYRASADANVAKGFKVGISVSGDIYKSRNTFFKQGSETLDNDVATLEQFPTWTKFYIDGNPVLVNTPGNFNSSKDNINFFEIAKSGDYTQNNNYIINMSANARYDMPFVKGLSLSGTYNRNVNNAFGKQYGSNHLYYSYSGLGVNNHIPGGTIVKSDIVKNGDRVRLNPNLTDTYQADAMVNYQRKFGKHDIAFLGLYEQSENYSEGSISMVEGVYVGGKDNENFAGGTQTANQVGLVSQSGRKAIAARLDYNYDDRYIVQVQFRGDANTKFAPGKQWGYFPSGSAGWVISNEKFFKDKVKFIDFLKIRGSVGLLGNDNTKAYQYQNSYTFATGHAASFGNSGAAGESTAARGTTVEPDVLLANPDAHWDNNLKVGLGVDVTMLNNRLSLSGDYYHDHRYNMLTVFNSSVPFVVGAPLPPENALSINSFGFEFSATWKDKIGKDFTYSLSPFVGWSDAKNIIIDQAVGLNNTYRDLRGKSDDPGFLGYHYLGIFKNDADVTNWLTSHPGYTLFGQTPKPGMAYYEDVRGPIDPTTGQYSAPDGKINDEDQDYLSKKQSNHYNTGLSIQLGYKGVSLGATLNSSFGGYGQYEGTAISRATGTSNRPAFWNNNYWTPTNQDAKYPAPYYLDGKPSSLWYVSTTTFFVTNMNVSYTFPQSFTKKLGVGSVRAYVVSVNPFNLYNPYNYRDNRNNYDTYPAITTLSFGLNVGF